MGEVGNLDVAVETQIATGIQLCAICGTHAFDYLISSGDHQSPHIRSHRFDKSYLRFDQPLGYLDSLMRADAALYDEFGQVKFAVRGAPFALAKDFDPQLQDARAILQKQTHVAKGDVVLRNDLSTAGLSLIFAVPERFEHELGLYFTGAHIWHNIAHQIETAVKSSLAGVTVHMCVAPGWVECVVLNDGALAFANHFRWMTPDDIVYFSSAVLTELGYAELPCQWKMYGSSMTDDLAEVMQQALQLEERTDDHVEITKGPNVELFSLAACES